MSYQSKYTGTQIDEAVKKVIEDDTYLPLSGGTMTGELGLKQGGVGMQLGTSGNICATDTHNGGITTRTILGAGIHWATDAAAEDEMTIGHPLFYLAMRGSKERPTYCAGTSKNNNTELALLDDIPKLGYSTPEMHGAIGDGVNDDAGAFTNVINDSDYVFLTSDLYLFTPVAITDKTRLVIDGNGYTINFKNIERALQITGSTNIIFRNIIFDGNSCTTQGVTFINCENIQVEKCTFKNMTTTSSTDGETWGLNFRDSKDMRVDFCSFLDIDGSGNSTKVANGIAVHGHTKGCEYITISNCYFDTILPVNDACGISLNQTNFYDTPLHGVVENCRFVDCAKRAVKIMAQNVTVQNCDIKDVLSTDIHASMIDIMASHCRVTNNTINVNSATYGISHQYVAPTSTITGFTDIVIENNYIYVANEDSTTARDGLTVGVVNETKLYEDIVVKNNIVKGAFRYAFKAMYIANSVIEGNTFEGEMRVGNRSLNDRPCINNRMVNNTVKGTLEFSVAHSLLAHNEFVGNGGFGIYYSTFTNGSPSNLRIVGNNFNNLSYGIHAGKQALDNVIITDNVFTNITTSDMLLNGTNYVVADNVLCKGVSGTFAAIPEPSITIADVDGLQNALDDKDASGSAANALSEAKSYTDTEIAELVNSAPTTLDTLGEIATAMEENADVVEALNNAIGAKANTTDLEAHINNTSNPHGVTAEQVGALPQSGGSVTGTIDVSSITTPLQFGTTGYFSGKTSSGNKFDFFGLINSTRFRVGGTYPALELMGKNERCTYNGENVALQSDIPTPTTETWTFTLEDGSTVTKAVHIG